MFPNFYDIAYGLGVAAASPVWLTRTATRRKVLGAFGTRMGRVSTRAGDGPAVMIHAVSVGEINAGRQLIERLRARRPELHVIVSTTTRTGHDRALELYGNNPAFTVIRFPLDFSVSVGRVLDQLRPNVVVLMELELWPNFMKACVRRGVPVVLANGRVTGPSFRRYRLGGPVTRKMFGRLSAACAQEKIYADRFMRLGAHPARTVVTGTMKFDTAPLEGPPPTQRLLQIAGELGLWPGMEQLLLCGSTGPGEEEIVLRAYRNLLARFSRLRLMIVPRKPERFDEVARLIGAAKFVCVRRSARKLPPGGSAVPPVILGDTMGELRTFYSLADLVFVGRSLVDLGPKQHGSDMIEPAALAKPIIVGPYTGNFAEAMRRFKEADALLEVPDAAALEEALAVLISSPDQAIAMADRARQVVQHERGATDQHVEIVERFLLKNKN